jgi:biotin carboxyl carrier protein
VAVSEDTRDSLRERLGLDVVVEADGELALARTDVPVSASGVISSVAVEAGEKVEEGDVLVVLTDVANGPSGLTPQQVQESAWLLLDELTAGSTDAPAEELSAAVLAADEAVTMTQLAVGEATDSGAGEEAVARLEEWARVALAARDIAEARLALAKDGPEAVDVGVIEEAMAVTELPSLAASSGESEWVVRAPVAGEVLDALPEEGAHVVIGQPVVSIRPAETTDALEIALSVTADDADQIEVGYAAEVVVDDRDDQFEGEVVGVRELDAAEADGDLTHVVIVLVRDRYGELEPGVTARVKIREQ